MSGILKHTNQPGTCFADAINSLVQDCNHEYYMSAIGSSSGTLERAKHGRLRILEAINEMERMKKEVGCLACRQEINLQIKLQSNGVLEIERVWKLSD
jgi:hypothetical protein